MPASVWAESGAPCPSAQPPRRAIANCSLPPGASRLGARSEMVRARCRGRASPGLAQLGSRALPSGCSPCWRAREACSGRSTRARRVLDALRHRRPTPAAALPRRQPSTSQTSRRSGPRPSTFPMTTWRRWPTPRWWLKTAPACPCTARQVGLVFPLPATQRLIASPLPHATLSALQVLCMDSAMLRNRFAFLQGSGGVSRAAGLPAASTEPLSVPHRATAIMPHAPAAAAGAVPGSLCERRPAGHHDFPAPVLPA